MQCTKPIRIQPGRSPTGIKNKFQKEYPEGLEVPCGKCLACRIRSRKEWSLRMLHEMEDHNDSIFITLTYDDAHIPDHQSLSKHHLQLFFKRLRKSISPRRLRYFACGEYGDNTNRPHYHAIIFGLSLGHEDRIHIDESWNLGMIHYGLAEPDSINYVAQYIDKKFTGNLAHEEYTLKNREPVFKLQSMGIGRSYCDTHKDELLDRQCINYRGKTLSLPRYYVKRLGLTNDLAKTRSEELDSQLTETHCGIYATSDQLYYSGDIKDNLLYINSLKKSQLQNDLNLHAKVKLKESKL